MHDQAPSTVRSRSAGPRSTPTTSPTTPGAATRPSHPHPFYSSSLRSGRPMTASSSPSGTLPSTGPTVTASLGGCVAPSLHLADSPEAQGGDEEEQDRVPDDANDERPQVVERALARTGQEPLEGDCTCDNCRTDEGKYKKPARGGCRA